MLEEVKAWQSRPLDPVYAVVFLDAIVVKVRDSQVVQNKPAYIAVGVDADGEKHVLGIWLSRTPPGSAAEGEGARFWGSVMADLRNRGVRDILIACVDGLAGFADAITAAFPQTVVQRCVVHLIRNALRPVARRDAAPGRRRAAEDLHGPDRRGRLRRPRRLRRVALGEEVPPGGPGLGAGLGRLHPVPGLLAAGAEDALHHQQHRVA